MGYPEVLAQPIPQYPLRSYALRCSRITKAQQHALHTYWPQFGIKTTNRPLDFATVFARIAPVTLEIGFGDGETLATIAEASPDIDFIGLEVYSPGIGMLLNKINHKALSNVRVIHADAATVIPRCFPNHSLTEILILFPDPWPKRRHHKRRLIQANFVSMLAAKLCIGGTLRLATDSKDYATAMHRAIAACGRYQAITPTVRPTTAYERRGRALKHRIYDLQYEVLAVRDDNICARSDTKTPYTKTD